MNKFKIFLRLFCFFIPLTVFAKSGLLFNVQTSGNNIAFPVTFELCLNAKSRPVSCQQFTTNQFNLSINTTIPNHTYPYAGIKLLTPDLKIASIGSVCQMNANGFCIFTASNSTPVAFNLLYDTGVQLFPSQIPNAIINQTYKAILTASNGVPPYRYTVQSGSLPNGLTLNSSTGLISGTPTTSGPSYFTIAVTDSSNPQLSTSNQYSIYVTGGTLSIAPFSPLPNGVLGSLYSQAFTASGGTAPYTYSTTTNPSYGIQLPPGLTLSTNTLTGYPSQVGNYYFYISASDNSSKYATQEYQLSIGGPLQITPVALPVLTMNQSYVFNFQTTGGTAPYVYTVYQGTLPFNMTLNKNGTLSGSPLLSGNYPIVIKSTDANGLVGIQYYQLNVFNNIFITPTELPSATINSAYSQTFQANGGTSPYKYYIASYNNPANLSLNSSTGIISGTPTVPGTYPFSIIAVDANGNSGIQNLNLQVYGNVLIYPTTLPSATVNQNYSASFTSTGGTSYTYSYTGSLPPGLTLSSAGLLSGVPTADGNYNFSIVSTDSATGNTGVQMYNFAVKGTIEISPPLISAASLGVPYSEELNATQGTAPYTYFVSAGQLPPGLSLDGSTGVLSGTPLYNNNYIFSISAIDADGQTGGGNIFCQSIKA